HVGSWDAFIECYTPKVYRTRWSGDLEDASTWEVKNGPNSFTYATLPPRYIDDSIIIRPGHTVTKSKVTYTPLDQVWLQKGGKLIINQQFGLNNGKGYDLIADGDIQMGKFGYLGGGDSVFIRGNITGENSSIFSPIYIAGTSPQTLNFTRCYFGPLHILNKTATTITGLITTDTLYMNTPGRLTIDSAEITYMLSLKNGIIDIMGKGLIKSPSSYRLKVEGGNDSSFVNGPLSLPINTRGIFTLNYPIGRNNIYKPVTLTISKQAFPYEDQYKVQVINQPPIFRPFADNSIKKVSSLRHYNVTSQKRSPVTSLNITLPYSDDDGAVEPSRQRIARDSGYKWVNIGGDITTLPGSIKSTEPVSTINNTTNTFGDFVLAYDNDCDGQTTTFYRDADGDTYGNPSETIQKCSAPDGYVSNNSDCDDTHASVHPGVTEVCNGIDDDCDGQTDEGVTTTFYRDADGDTYGNPSETIQACFAPDGYVSNSTDCDDSPAGGGVHPGATEICNSIDDDCDGDIDEGCGLSQPPSVTIIAPTTNTTIVGPVDITFTATALDADGTITKVEFYNGTKLMATERYLPYSWTWKNSPIGKRKVTAKAYDNDGLVTVSAPVHVTVVAVNPSTISIVYPLDNATYNSPADVRITAVASKEGGAISKVEFYNGATLLATEKYLPYSWNWVNAPVGTHPITVKAYYISGAAITSQTVTITVNSLVSFVSRVSSENSKSNINASVTLNLVPNPANDILNIYTTGLPKDKQMIISVISTSGVIMKTIRKPRSAQVVQLNVSSLADGVYTIKIISDDKIMYKAFVKL
ncbi:MAG: Ig-like domain-containing protein, partial [Ginsengibacter sp.]